MHLLRVHFLLEFNHFPEGDLVNLIVMVSDHDTLLIIHQGFNGGIAKFAGRYTVMGRRGTAPLDMSQNGNPYIVILKVIFYTLCNGEGTTRFISFCHDDDIARFFPFKVLKNVQNIKYSQNN